MGRLGGKVALITGAARGQGAVFARRFVEEGARVMLTDVAHDEGLAVAADLGDGAAFQRMDISQQDEWKETLEVTMARFGKLDVLVNNAGKDHYSPLSEITRAEIVAQFEVNQLGPLLGIITCAPALEESGAGAIVNVASIDGMRGTRDRIGYTSTKWAVRGITKAAAIELSSRSIRVNAILPGLIMTSMTEALPTETLDALVEMIPLKRAGVPLDTANAAVYLASDESAYVTASEIVVDGGVTSDSWASATQIRPMR